MRLVLSSIHACIYGFVAEAYYPFTLARTHLCNVGDARNVNATDSEPELEKGQSMSWSDTLKGVVGNIVGQAEQGALPDILKGVLGTEGLQAILGKLQDAGLGAQVSSWLDKNKNNLPITPEQIKSALGDEHVQQIAKSLGIPVDSILAALASALPEAASAAGPAADPQNASPLPGPKSG